MYKGLNNSSIYGSSCQATFLQNRLRIGSVTIERTYYIYFLKSVLICVVIFRECPPTWSTDVCWSRAGWNSIIILSNINYIRCRILHSFSPRSVCARKQPGAWFRMFDMVDQIMTTFGLKNHVWSHTQLGCLGPSRMSSTSNIKRIIFGGWAGPTHAAGQLKRGLVPKKATVSGGYLQPGDVWVGGGSPSWPVTRCQGTWAMGHHQLFFWVFTSRKWSKMTMFH